MSFIFNTTLDEELDRYANAENAIAANLGSNLNDTKKQYNVATNKNEFFKKNQGGGYVKVFEQELTALEDAQMYNQSLLDKGFTPTRDDFYAAGFDDAIINEGGFINVQPKSGITEPLTEDVQQQAFDLGFDVVSPEKQSLFEDSTSEIIKGLVRGGLVRPAQFLKENFNIYDPLVFQVIDPQTGEFDPAIKILSREEKAELDQKMAAGELPYAFDFEELVETDEEAGAGAQVMGTFAQFIGAYAGLGKLFRLGKNIFVGGMTQGAAADFMAFRGDEGRLSDILYELGVPENQIVNFLQTDPNDPDYVGRFKTALEGGVLGTVAEPILLGIGKAFRAVKDGDIAKEQVLPFIDMAKDNMRDTLSNVVKDVAERLNQPGQMPPLGSNLGNAGDEINKAIQLFDQAKIRREATTGRYVGGPPGLDTPQKLAALRKKVSALVEQGAPGRFWYERSGKAILDAVGGDKVEAEKIAQAIAITSSGTPVGANFDFALQAYLQNKAGQPISTGRFPQAMNKRLTDMFNGTPWEGRKTNSFYVNLMREIDPTLDQPVTVDIWMLRAFGYGTDNPTSQQYTFVENEVNKLADELGWEPQQVQAAIWVKAKADDESISVDRAKFDYADALEKNKMQISWESIPGRTSNHMSEMFDAPYEVQQQYHVDISKAFLDDNGNDIVAQRLGIPSPGDFEAPGYFEGKVSPGTQTELAVPKQYKGPNYGAVEPAALELVNAYAAVRGILMKQDGVGFHRPFFNSSKKDANGVLLDIGRNFTERETARLGEILAELSGHTDYNPIAAPGGVRIINFAFLRKNPDGSKAMEDTWFSDDMLKTNKEFHKLVEEAVAKLDLDDNVGIDFGTFNAQEGYVGNDWSVNKNGEDYIKAASGQGSSDIQRKVQDLITELSPRIDAIDTEYQIRHGFTGNPEINAEFRSGITPPSEP